MVQMIIGKKGKGKTKQLLDRVNTSIKTANGNIVYIDKSSKHMLELNNKIRLIDASGFGLKNYDEFIGFILGIISRDHDLEEMYLDSFLMLQSLRVPIAQQPSKSWIPSAKTLMLILYSVFLLTKMSFRQSLVSISLLRCNTVTHR